MNATIGQNLKRIREYNNFSQEQVSEYLGINRSTYSNYELGDREAPLELLEKAALLYGCDLSLFFEEDITLAQELLLCSFRVDSIASADLAVIADFKDIVNSYVKINRLLNEA